MTSSPLFLSLPRRLPLFWAPSPAIACRPFSPSRFHDLYHPIPLPSATSLSHLLPFATLALPLIFFFLPDASPVFLFPCVALSSHSDSSFQPLPPSAHHPTP
ncbi:hypothetical protein NL676_036265 [Syzygium grande]|nr:hypothetical protein NL676_036265 [Syzygium grande]